MAIKRPRLLATAAVAVLSALAFSTNASGGQSFETVSPPAPLIITETDSGERAFDLRVMTFNVAGLPGPLRKTRGDALKLIGEELRKMRAMDTAPHILIVQEAFSGEAQAIGLAGGYAYRSFGPDADSAATIASPNRMPEVLAARQMSNGEGLGKLTGSGLAIFSDLPITRTEMTAFGADDCAGTDCFANKGVMLVNIAVPGMAGGIDIANTHMNSLKAAGKPYSRSLLAYERQSDVMRAFIDARATPGAPMIFAGDFNASETRDRYAYLEKSLSGLDEMFGNCAASDQCALGIKPVDGGFWNASLDMHWVRHASGASIVPTSIGWAMNRPVQGTALSDHKAVLAHYRISWKAAERIALQ